MLRPFRSSGVALTAPDPALIDPDSALTAPDPMFAKFVVPPYNSALLGAYTKYIGGNTPSCTAASGVATAVWNKQASGVSAIAVAL